MISAEDLEKQIEALVVEHCKKLGCYLRGPKQGSGAFRSYPGLCGM
jgi:hypothetical protein